MSAFPELTIQKLNFLGILPGLILMSWPMSSRAASTCDMSYLDGGRAWAWNTFFCEDFANNGTVPEALHTCFYGYQQSPINLDVNEASRVNDLDQLTFNGFEARLSQSPVIRQRSFALQLDFEPTSTTTAAPKLENDAMCGITTGGQASCWSFTRSNISGLFFRTSAGGTA